jgi:RNA polymerase sigma factor (sigma-70 family)
MMNTNNYYSILGNHGSSDTETLLYCVYNEYKSTSSFYAQLFEDYREQALQDDRLLISRCLGGEQDAWSDLYRRLYKPVHYITHWHKWNFTPDHAEEITQEVFLSLVTSLKTFNFDCSLETFATNIARNKCISEIRRVSALKRDGDKDCLSTDAMDEDGNNLVSLADNSAPLSRQIDQGDITAVMQAALDSIEEKCRTIIRLKYYNDYSYEDIAALSNLPLGTVASRLKRCLLELRKLCLKHTGGNLENIM